MSNCTEAFEDYLYSDYFARREGPALSKEELAAIPQPSSKAIAEIEALTKANDCDDPCKETIAEIEACKDAIRAARMAKFDQMIMWRKPRAGNVQMVSIGDLLAHMDDSEDYVARRKR